MPSFETIELLVCRCCALLAANGEVECECDHDPLSKIADGDHVIVTDDTDGQFTDWHSCDGCGDGLAGDRLTAVILRPKGTE